MNRLVSRNYRLSLGMGLAFLLLAILVACGPGEEPTPVPTPTKPAAVATPTPTQPAVVATPTPTAVAAPSPTAAVQPQRGGTLKLVDVAYVSNFNIYVEFSGGNPTGTRWWSKLHNNLLVNYVDEEVECEVCSEWHLENQGKTMVFTLIPGIKFHDGRELTSADVKYSLRMIMGEVDGIISPRGGIIKEYIESIDTPSKYEVRLNLLRPSQLMASALSLEVMMMIQDGTTREQMKTKYFGSGPFILKRAISGASWSLERNPSYWKQGQPYIDKIEYTVVPEDATRIAAIVTGAADYWIGLPAAPFSQYRPTFYKMAEEGKVFITHYPYSGNAPGGPFLNNMKPPFDNIKMRLAASLAWDRKALGVVAYEDFAVARMLGLGSDSFYGQPENEVWNVVPGWGTGAKKQQEIEQAKQLVKDAGYPNGVDVVITARPPGATAITEPAAQMLSDVGIRSTLKIITPAELVTIMSDRTYTILDYGLAGTLSDPEAIIGQFFLTGASRNWFDFSNREVDQLFLQMATELDPAKRKALYHRIRDIILIDEVVVTEIASTKAMQVFRSRVQGFTGVMNAVHAGSGFQRADRLWLKQ